MRRSSIRPSVNLSAAAQRKTHQSESPSKSPLTAQSSTAQKFDEKSQSPSRQPQSPPDEQLATAKSPQRTAVPSTSSSTSTSISSSSPLPQRRRRQLATPNLDRPRQRPTPQPPAEREKGEKESSPNENVIDSAPEGSPCAPVTAEDAGPIVITETPAVVSTPVLQDPPPVRRVSFAATTSEVPNKPSTVIPSIAVQRPDKIPAATPIRADKHPEKRTVMPNLQDRRHKDLKEIEKEMETPAKRRKKYTRMPPPDRTKMTMSDLIYYNPKNNPMMLKEDVQNITLKPNVDTAEKRDNETTTGFRVDKADGDGEDSEGEDSSAMPVPQVTIGEDGQIVINEESLIVEASPQKSTDVSDKGVILESADTSITTYSSYRSCTHSAVWTRKETAKFYKAISMVGTDFSMIGAMFPKRTRQQIKNKFKREEKLNRQLIDTALKERQKFDPNIFKEGDEQEPYETEQKKRAVRTKRKLTGPKRSGGIRSAADPDRIDDKENGSDLDEDSGSAEVDDLSDREEGAVVAEDSEEVVEVLHGPTRFGRHPKPRQAFTIEHSAVKKRGPRKKHQDEQGATPTSIITLTSPGKGGQGPSSKVMLVTSPPSQGLSQVQVMSVTNFQPLGGAGSPVATNVRVVRLSPSSQPPHFSPGSFSSPSPSSASAGGPKFRIIKIVPTPRPQGSLSRPGSDCRATPMDSGEAGDDGQDDESNISSSSGEFRAPDEQLDQPFIPPIASMDELEGESLIGNITGEKLTANDIFAQMKADTTAAGRGEKGRGGQVGVPLNEEIITQIATEIANDSTTL